MNSTKASALSSTLQHLSRRKLAWQGHEIRSRDLRPTGQALLDEKLGGGLPAQGLIDLRSMLGIGELRLLLPALTAPETTQDRLCVFIAPPAELNAESLSGLGLELTQVLLARPSTGAQALWAAEQSLKSGASHAVWLWQEIMTHHQARRLQLAAQEGEAQLLLLRTAEAPALPASLTMELMPHPDGLCIRIPRHRGGWPVSDFVLDMRRQWPELTSRPNPEQALPLTEEVQVV